MSEQLQEVKVRDGVLAAGQPFYAVSDGVMVARVAERICKDPNFAGYVYVLSGPTLYTPTQCYVGRGRALREAEDELVRGMAWCEQRLESQRAELSRVRTEMASLNGEG